MSIAEDLPLSALVEEIYFLSERYPQSFSFVGVDDKSREIIATNAETTPDFGDPDTYNIQLTTGRRSSLLKVTETRELRPLVTATLIIDRHGQTSLVKVHDQIILDGLSFVQRIINTPILSKPNDDNEPLSVYIPPDETGINFLP